ncbi:hypothetical protein [Mucisphaera calidilacus]|uniref:Uncharacterized protein n=1 Tax=Mucisphaera calidilacus TaxID=2527982 RepID=A0A518BTK1_9BACT|nr:hypothetical protein [Mucisphaera calidilacus]QDU70285.1 hypothetical protein Pan265_01080 [Mucisphaera calidilacus]
MNHPRTSIALIIGLIAQCFAVACAHAAPFVNHKLGCDRPCCCGAPCEADDTPATDPADASPALPPIFTHLPTGPTFTSVVLPNFSDPTSPRTSVTFSRATLCIWLH